MDIINCEKKEQVAYSFNNTKFKVYSNYDISILIAAIVIDIFIIIITFVGSLKVNLVEIILMIVPWVVVLIQIIRINIVNVGVYFELGNGRELLIMKGFLCKKYIIDDKEYVLKKNQIKKINNCDENLFIKLITYFKDSEIFFTNEGNRTVYSTKLLDSKGNCLDWLVKTALPEKYVKLVFQGDRLSKAILNGSQHRCATYFKFVNLKDDGDKLIKLPDAIKNLINS